MSIIRIAVVDDHILLRNGLANLINAFEGFQVIIEAKNGKDFINNVDINLPPDLVLLDINMPEMDGYQTAEWIRLNMTLSKVLALSMYDNDSAVLRMLKSGARGYVLKDIEPADLKTALKSVITKGYYYSDLVTSKIIHALNDSPLADEFGMAYLKLSEREIEFLKLVCTELTYKEIADRLFLSPRTIDGYRDQLFEKLKIKTRVGLAIFAIKNGIVQI